jgi:hypothetical protein
LVTIPRCIVLAHGRALRLSRETGGASKGLLSLDDRTTILTNLLDACHAQGLDPILTVRPGDRRLAEFATDKRAILMKPGGYIVDVVSLSAGTDDVIVLDCDTVAEPVAVQSALQALLASTSDCTLALAARPLSNDPRSIRPVLERGRLTRLSDDPCVPRTTGLYRFEGDTLESMRRFVNRGCGTFHDFMEWSALWSRPMAVHVMEIAFNVNWSTDYHAARTWWNQPQRQHRRLTPSIVDHEVRPTS